MTAVDQSSMACVKPSTITSWLLSRRPASAWPAASLRLHFIASPLLFGERASRQPSGHWIGADGWNEERLSRRAHRREAKILQLRARAARP